MQASEQTREVRGRAIFEKKTEVTRVDENEYTVKSQSGRGDYQVVSTEVGWYCSCPDAMTRAVKCKHVFAVELSIKFRTVVGNQVLAPILNTEACIFCGSKHVVKDGVRKNKSGDIQRFVCKECGKFFTVNIGFERMKHNPQAITSAMQLYFSGESLRSTQRSLELLGVKVCPQTIHNWISKYVKLMEKYLDKIIPQVGNNWRADEVHLKVRGDPKYLFALMDDETRFWISQQVADTKGTSDVRPLLKKAKERADKLPEVFITDGAPNFHDAYRKEFWDTYGIVQSPAHIRHIHLAGDHNNNKMERINGEIRDREKTMRSLKTTDTPILKGMQIFHNFIRPHMGLPNEITPAEAAGITVEGQNKWKTIIQNAASAENGREVQSADK